MYYSFVSSPKALKNYNKTKDEIQPLYTFSGHQSEGFAVDWSSTSPGMPILKVLSRDDVLIVKYELVLQVFWPLVTVRKTFMFGNRTKRVDRGTSIKFPSAVTLSLLKIFSGHPTKIM